MMRLLRVFILQFDLYASFDNEDDEFRAKCLCSFVNQYIPNNFPIDENVLAINLYAEEVSFLSREERKRYFPTFIKTPIATVYLEIC